MDTKLLQELTACVGEKWVLTEPGQLFLYSFDSALDRGQPQAVVLPGTPEQLALVVRILSKHKKPYVVRGAATSLCGGPVPLHGAVVIGVSRLTRMTKVNREKSEIVVEPGVVNLRLQEVVARDGLFYPPDPGSQKACTLGGNVGTNAGGPHCLKYGVTSQFVAGLEVVLPDGQVVQLRADDPGYDLISLFVGSEGTLGIASRIILRLLPKPLHVRTMLASFPSIESAIQTVTDIIGTGVLPATLEAMDKTTVTAVEAFVHAGYPVEAEAVLLIEVDGDQKEELDRHVVTIQDLCARNKSLEFRFAKDETERIKLWEGRRGAYAAMARLAPNVLVEDGAVPRTRLPEALAKIKQIAQEADLRVALLFHAGDGNLHPQIIFDERDAQQTRIVKEAGYKMLKACVDLGGTISGEHGIGIDKREAMKWLFNRETLSLFRRIKNVFDPENFCNPDKLIPLVSKAPAEPPPERPLEVKISADGSTTPANEEEMAAIVRQWARDKTFFGVQGSGTKYGVRDNAVIKTTALNKVLDFDRGNLTITVQGGAPLEPVRAALEKEGRYLWMKGPGTVGGVIATRACVVPPIRDLILGMRVLLPTGEIVNFGAKTMKNVAGYDAAKLLIGSWGTLGIILDVTLRVYATAPKALKDAPVRPFVMRDLHKKVKKAFDPGGILSSRIAMLTAKDLEAAAAAKTETVKEAPPSNIGDKFWI